MSEPVLPTSKRKILLTDGTSVYGRILEDIAEGYFAGGERLVTTQLAKRYNTSINPVREALKQLQGEGFVTTSQNSGASVTKFEHATMRDVFEILQLLDPYLLSYFAENHSSEQLSELYSLQQEIESLDEKEFTQFRMLDTEFHWLMYKDHYNNQAVEIWRKNRLILHTMHANLPVNISRVCQSIREHRELLEALQSGEPNKAVKLLRAHIGKSGKYWFKFYRS